MTVINFLLAFLFPRRCVSCGKIGKYLCRPCGKMVQTIKLQVCPVCERPAIGGLTHPGCQTRYSLDGLSSFFIYDGPMKKAIKQLKYQFVTDLAEELIDLMPQNRVALYKWRREAILTPVPLHFWRQNWRGFNQAEVLGKMISDKLGIKFIPDLLLRKKYTQPQVELKGEERKENILNAFRLNPRYISVNQRAADSILVSEHHRLIIFDDVWTTGATLRTCGRVLKEAGAKEVWGLTLAR